MSYSLSIITPVYNSVESLPATLASLKNQSFTDFEHIIVDGGSTDGSLELLEDWATSERVTVISEKDDGIYDALNKGISTATGEVVGILHSDDAYANKHVLANIIGFFTTPEIQLVYGDLAYVSRNGSSKATSRYWKAGIFQPNRIVHGWMPPHPTVFIRLESIRKYNLIYDTRYTIAADYEYLLRCLVRYRITPFYYQSLVTHMSLGGISNGSLGGLFRKSIEDYHIMEHYGLPAPYTLAAKVFRKIPQFFRSG